MEDIPCRMQWCLHPLRLCSSKWNSNLTVLQLSIKRVIFPRQKKSRATLPAQHHLQAQALSRCSLACGFIFVSTRRFLRTQKLSLHSRQEEERQKAHIAKTAPLHWENDNFAFQETSMQLSLKQVASDSRVDRMSPNKIVKERREQVIQHLPQSLVGRFKTPGDTWKQHYPQ